MVDMAKDYLNTAGLTRFWNNIKGQIGHATSEQVDAWLDAHPEATTTVQDNSINGATKLIDGSVPDSKLAQSGGVLDSLKQNYSNIIAIEQGYWSVADGTATSSNSWCRTSKFINKNCTVKTSTLNMWLMAYNNVTGAYVGTWDGTEFNTTYNADLSVKAYNLYEFVKNYPDYMFAISFKSSSQISPSDVYSQLTVISDDFVSIDVLAAFESADFIQGAISNNTFYPNETTSITSKNYYTIKEASQITITDNDQDATWTVRLCFYDENKNWISQYGYADIDGSLSYNGVGDAKYIKVCLGRKIAGQLVNTAPSDLGNDKIIMQYKIDVQTFADTVIKDITKIKSELHNNNDNERVWTGSVSNPSEGSKYYAAIEGLTLFKQCKYKITTYSDSNLNNTSNVAIRVNNTTKKSYNVKANQVQSHIFVPDETLTNVSIEHYCYNTTGTIYDTVELLDGSLSYPVIFKSQMETKVPLILSNMCDVGANGETFVFITDIHWEQNFQNSPQLIEYLLDNLNINKLICGGDLINQGEKSDMIALIMECVKAFYFKNHFFACAVGNHDDNSNFSPAQPAKRLSQDAVYSLMQKQSEEFVTFVTDGPWNYYFDTAATKTRFIVLDTGPDGSFNNYQELYDMLTSIPSGYHAIIVCHWLYSGGNKSAFCLNLESIIDAYNDRSSGTAGGISYDFTSCVGDVKIVISGHVHMDMSWTTPDGVPVVLTDCDCALRTESSMEYGTVDEQCFDVITLDYDNSTAKFVRIGRGENRNFNLV